MSDALRNEATERLHIDYEKLVKDVDGLLKEVKALQHENNPDLSSQVAALQKQYAALESAIKTLTRCPRMEDLHTPDSTAADIPVRRYYFGRPLNRDADYSDDEADERFAITRCLMDDSDIYDGLLQEAKENQEEERAEAVAPPCCSYLTDATKRLGASLIATHSATYHSPTGRATRDEIKAFHTAKCNRIKYVHRRSILQHMHARDCLPWELRDMIYGYVFENSCVQLDAEHLEHACSTSHSQKSYRQLIDFKFFAADTGIKNELAEMWYKMTTFWTTDPSTISSCLSRFKWSAVLEAKPFGLIRNVEIWIPVDVTQGILEETPDLARADPLFQLHETTTIRFALGGPDSMDNTFPGRGVPYYNAEDYAENIEYLFPLFANLRAAGYKVIVGPDWNRRVVFEPDITQETMIEMIFWALAEQNRLWGGTSWLQYRIHGS
ncbi:uncharacterized protein J4E84_009232 [Alternaria hordeiaustralica]|uniref:uncharacterized protein n=1 Tax=Alternaria hordeiaustralica TaxID=1187925 RepID=UPI0020C3A3E4|nr:uncharacterized protein J4E84_009232 [Alternaria hordeiaustralica]KAI4676932.1 hypothetical protein J4E84_009232 [Alternaria hordeiaustralica]